MHEDLPLLGEPPAVELANTWYGTGEEVTDFLADSDVARQWVALALGGGEVGDLAALREVRDATRALFLAQTRGEPLGAREVQVINAHAARATATVALRTEGEKPLIHARLHGDAAARAAVSCVHVLAFPDPVLLCEGPGCTMFFVQHHGRRRFCSEGCSHRQRQARYRRSRA